MIDDEKELKLAGDIATIIEKISATEKNVVAIYKQTKATNGHVAKSINDINIQAGQIKAVEIKADNAVSIATEAKKSASSSVRWVVSFIFGNLVLYASIMLYLINTQ